MLTMSESRHPQPFSDLSIGDRVDLLPWRVQPFVRGRRILPLLGHELGDVLDPEQPLPGVSSQDVAPQAKLDRTLFDRAFGVPPPDAEKLEIIICYCLVFQSRLCFPQI